MIKIARIIVVFFLCFLFTGPVFAGISPEFREKLISLKWVAYSPTNFDPDQNIYPGEESIRRDLVLLHNYGFHGVVTYGSLSTLASIPAIAKDTGFDGVIMGIWDIEDSSEINNAIAAAEYVDGYCVGNEGLNCKYDIADLTKAISMVKAATGKPATTTQQVFDYANDAVFAVGDWIFPNIHPFLSQIRSPQKAADWIKRHYQRLQKHCEADRAVLFKEVGFPTVGSKEATQSNQAKFFEEMQKTDIPFVYFEAFDQPWKTALPVEPYWGLFSSNRGPKKFISSVKANGGF